jgi:hypothetical protein
VQRVVLVERDVVPARKRFYRTGTKGGEPS